MKTKIATCIIVALMLLSGVSQAQKRNRAERMQKTMIKLTDAQKDELKVAKVEFAKATLDVKNELNELEAYQRTLMSAEKLDKKKVFENIDNMTTLKKQLMEERINMGLATSGLLDEDQKMQRHMRGDRSKMREQNMKRGKDQMRKGNRKAFAEKGERRGFDALDLSEKQKEQIKTVRLENRKATQNLREEMQELRLKQKHLLNDDVPNKTEISSNIDRISTIQNKLAKESVQNQIAIRKILDEDQLVLFLSKSHKMKKNRNTRMHRAL